MNFPQTALTQLQTRFEQAAAQADYPQMVVLMDSMDQAYQAIDRNGAATTLERFQQYAPHFETSVEGRTVYHLYLYRFQRKNEYVLRRAGQVNYEDNKKAVLKELEGPFTALSTAQLAKYQEFFLPTKASGYLPGRDIYPCTTFEELVLLTLLNDIWDNNLNNQLIALYEKDPHPTGGNYILALLKRINEQDHEEFLLVDQYREAYQALIDRFPKEEAITHVYAALVRHLQSNASTENDYQEIVDLCHLAAKKFPRSESKEWFKQIIKDIEAPHFSFNTREQIYPHQEFTLRLRHTNTPRLTLVIKKGCRTVLRQRLTLDAPLHIEVTDTISVKAPKEGHYILRIKQGREVASTDLYVGKVAAFQQVHRGKVSVYAVDYQSGAPFQNVEVVVDQNAPEPLTLNGFTPYPKKLEGQNHTVRVQLPATASSKADSFSVPLTINRWDLQRGLELNTEVTRMQLFTDRKLYKPGDSLSFKGIVTRYAQYKTQTVDKQPVTVILRSASNYNDTLATWKLVTNAYGSFSGTTELPKDLLNGVYLLHAGSASAQIRIESYSRPNFYITLDRFETVYHFGDTVTQQGTLTNYAGFPVENATVTYSVTRRMVTPWGIDKDVAKGTVTTNAQGQFSLQFPALAPSDPQHARCRYLVEIQATHPSGETYSAEAHIPVAGVPLTIQYQLRQGQKSAFKDYIEREMDPQVVLTPLNLYGTPQDLQGTYTLLNAQKEVLFEGTFGKDYTTQPQWDQLPSGDYTLTYQVPSVEGTLDQTTFSLLSLNDTQSPSPEPLFFYPLDHHNERAFLLGTRKETLHTLVMVYAGDSLSHQEYVTLNKEMRKVTFPLITPEEEPVTVRLLSVLEGKPYREEYRFKKIENKTLEVKLHTLREKAQPNSPQTVTLSISPVKDAEALVTIYNASTDRMGANSLAFQPAQAPYVQPPYLTFHFDDFSYGYSEPQRLFASLRGSMNIDYRSAPDDAVLEENAVVAFGAAPTALSRSATKNAAYQAMDQVAEEETAPLGAAKETEKLASTTAAEAPGVTPRTDFAETLAFLPHLTFNAKGNAKATFQTNGLLSTFRLLAMAHSKDGFVGNAEGQLIVQKEVMALPTYPAFLREGDRIFWQSSLVNLTKKPLRATAQTTVDGRSLGARSLTLAPSEAQLLDWEYQSTDHAADQATLTVTASLESEQHSDAEQHLIPVLSRRELVTRAQTQILAGEGLLTLVQQDKQSEATLEVTTPVHAALNALPALYENQYNNLTNWLAIFYANQTGAWLLTRYPELVASIEALPTGQVGVMEGQEALTQIRLSETPWASFKEHEARRIAQLRRLLDPTYVQQTRQRALNYFKTAQKSDGGFAWFEGMDSSYWLTLLFLEKMGELQEMGVVTREDKEVQGFITKAVAYLDNTFAQRYSKHKDKELSYHVANYFFVRTAFLHIPYQKSVEKAIKYYTPKIKTAWSEKSVLEKAWWTLVLERMGEADALAQARASLKEFAIRDKTLGMYFPNALPYYGLNSRGVGAHSLLLYLFRNDPVMCREIKHWILLQKKNNWWGSFEETTDAVYGLLALSETSPTLAQYEVNQHGTTYTVRNRSNVLLFASLYEQRTEDLKDVRPYAHEMAVRRVFFIETPQGWKPLEEGHALQKGNHIKVRYVIDNEQERSFVHLKASRAACLMVEDEQSGYRWQHTAGFYREVKESLTNYFFQSLTEGQHIIEETFYVTQRGTFNSGFAQIQSLYAPEYRGFSASGTINVVN